MSPLKGDFPFSSGLELPFALFAKIEAQRNAGLLVLHQVKAQAKSELLMEEVILCSQVISFPSTAFVVQGERPSSHKFIEFWIACLV
jgi:hypothetical protein